MTNGQIYAVTCYIVLVTNITQIDIYNKEERHYQNLGFNYTSSSYRAEPDRRVMKVEVKEWGVVNYRLNYSTNNLPFQTSNELRTVTNYTYMERKDWVRE